MRIVSVIGGRVSGVFEKSAPDPFVIAIGLTVLTLALAVLFGYEVGDGGEPDRSRLVAALDAWRGGLWGFLGFGMQMCLVLVTGYAVATSGAVSRVIDWLAARPGSARQAVVLVGAVAMGAGLVNWGLGLIVGALLAREVGVRLVGRGVPVHYPLLCAAGYMGMLVWHGGLSGSAPLVMSRAENAGSVLPASVLERLGDDVAVGLDQTVLTWSNLVITGGMVVCALVVLWLLHPPADEARALEGLASGGERRESDASGVLVRSVPDWFERTGWVAWLAGLLFVVAGVRSAWADGLSRVGLNEINVLLLGIGLLLHGSVRSYLGAVEEGARGCAGIIVQFPLYAGIMAVMTDSGLARAFSEWMSGVGEATGLEGAVPAVSYLSAAAVNLFVPSGGGQWGLQGPIALEAGASAGIESGRMIMAVAYGDQLTNMLQPFWALPLLAITRVKARDLVGATSVVMVVVGVWVVGALLIGL